MDQAVYQASNRKGEVGLRLPPAVCLRSALLEVGFIRDGNVVQEQPGGVLLVSDLGLLLADIVRSLCLCLNLVLLSSNVLLGEPVELRFEARALHLLMEEEEEEGKSSSVLRALRRLKFNLFLLTISKQQILQCVFQPYFPFLLLSSASFLLFL